MYLLVYFTSSLTKNQIIAAVVSLIINIIIMSISAININPLLTRFFQWISILNRFEDFQKGLINIPSIIFYISFTFIFLFLTIRVIEKRRLS